MDQRSGVPRAPGALELAVYRVVVAAGPRGVTAAEVAVGIDPSPVRGTVVTTFRRLQSRGVLVHHRDGRSVRYTTTADSGAVTATATARRMRHLLDGAPDRARVLAEFVAGLPPDEVDMLRLIVDSAGWSAAERRALPRWDRGLRGPPSRPGPSRNPWYPGWATPAAAAGLRLQTRAAERVGRRPAEGCSPPALQPEPDQRPGPARAAAGQRVRRRPGPGR